MPKSLRPFVCQSHSPSQQRPPPLTQGKPRCGAFLPRMTLVQVSMEKLMRRRMETRTWHEVNLCCILRSKKQMVFQTGLIFFFLSCVTYKLRSAEAPVGLPLKTLRCSAEILNRNSRQKASRKKERGGEAWSIAGGCLTILLA